MNAPSDRSEDTERRYERAGRALLSAFRRDMVRAGLWQARALPAGRPAMDALAAWLLARAARRRWVPRTFVWNRRALVRALERAAARGAWEPDGEGLAQLARLPAPGNLPRTTSRGPARKARRMPPGPLAELRAWLRARGGPYDALADLWLEAQRLTGLRPSEWAGARWLECADAAGRPCGVLAVPNGKVNAGMRRGNGPWRHLVFQGPLLGARREAITAFLTALEAALSRRVPASPGDASGDTSGEVRRRAFAAIYGAVRARVRRANLALWGRAGWNGRGRTITLYSGRHQFAADAKSAGGGGLSRAELAALMGHASADSAHVHYAGRSAGSGRPPQALPRALAAEAARVREPSRFRRALPSSGPAPGNGEPEPATER